MEEVCDHLKTHKKIRKNLVSPSQYSERLAEKEGQVVQLFSDYRLQLVKIRQRQTLQNLVVVFFNPERTVRHQFQPQQICAVSQCDQSMSFKGYLHTLNITTRSKPIKIANILNG